MYFLSPIKVDLKNRNVYMTITSFTIKGCYAKAFSCIVKKFDYKYID